MRKLILIFIFLPFFSYSQGIKMESLPSATLPINGADILMINQSTNTRKLTLNKLIWNADSTARIIHDTLSSYLSDSEVRSEIHDSIAAQNFFSLGHTLTVDTINEYTTANGVVVDGLTIKDTGINFESGATTRIFKDGSNNLSFTDAVTGTKTLAELATVADVGIIHVAKAEILYTNQTQTTIITLPANAVIWSLGIESLTTFNDSGTDIVNIGITGNINAIFSSDDGNLTAPNFSYLDIPYKVVSSTNITFTYDGQNNDATQGQAFIYIHYSLH